jgi:mono/diheme cytochrome c family protein
MPFPQSSFRFGAVALIGFGAFLSVLPAADKKGDDEWVAPKEEAAVKNPVKADEASLASGAKIYEARCTGCHGKTGMGDGPDSADLGIHPPKLTEEDIVADTDGALHWKITTGHRPMPAYGKRLTPEEIWHVINYVRTLQLPEKDGKKGK